MRSRTNNTRHLTFFPRTGGHFRGGSDKYNIASPFDTSVKHDRSRLSPVPALSSLSHGIMSDATPRSIGDCVITGVMSSNSQ